MREILFRGKRKDNGEWVEGSLEITHIQPLHKKKYDLYEIRNITVENKHSTCMKGSCEEVDPSTVGQFTGLTDKNGKLIFEGDIIRVGRSYMFDDDDCKAEIGVGIVTLGIGTFDMGFYRYLGWHCKKSDGDVDSYPIVDCDEEWISEVISNIHDNPELLEVSGDD